MLYYYVDKRIIFSYKYTVRMPKRKLTLSVDKEIINEAKKLDINISSFLEIRLREYVAITKGIVKSNNLWTERDLNPRPPPCEGGDLPLIYQPLNKK